MDEGYKYKLNNYQESQAQIMLFVKCSANGEVIQDGTTNEEVLRMIIDRLYYLNKQLPCRENSIVITKLEEALMWLEKRAAFLIRQSLNIEATNKPH